MTVRKKNYFIKTLRLNNLPVPVPNIVMNNISERIHKIQRTLDFKSLEKAYRIIKITFDSPVSPRLSCQQKKPFFQSTLL